MTTRFKAHFDGKAIVPDQPVDLPTGEMLTVQIETEEKATSLQQMLDVARKVDFDKASLAEMNRAIDF